MRPGQESWRISRASSDDYGTLFHEIVIGRVPYLPYIEPLIEDGPSAEAWREKLRDEQLQFLQTMAMMQDLEGDEPPAIDLRIGKPVGYGTGPKLFIAVVGRVTARHREEAVDYAHTLWRHLSTVFPPSYRLEAPGGNDVPFLNTVLPTEEDLQNAEVWELVKDTHAVPRGNGRGYIDIVGTYSDLLDSMITSWESLAYNPTQAFLSVRCVPLSAIETEEVRNEADWYLRRFGAGFAVPQDISYIEEAHSRFYQLLSSTPLFRLRIQLVSWVGDLFEVKGSIKASLTAPISSQRPCLCSWLPSIEEGNRQRVLFELTNVSARKQELDNSLQVFSPAQPFKLNLATPARSSFVSNYDVISAREANAAWRLPLARRDGIAGVDFKRDPHFTPDPFVPPSKSDEKGDQRMISLGHVLSRVRERRVQKLEVDRLARHMLVMGEPGAGKSTTTQSIVLQLWQQGIPALIIDPITSEYRELYALSSLFRVRNCQNLAGKSSDEDCSLCVFTPGSAGEMGMQLAFNPFCPQPGIGIDSHIMTLKRSFSSAFSMAEAWSELVGRALRSLYLDFGWPADNPNYNNVPLTTEDIQQRPFPTMIDLIKSVEREVVRFGRTEFATNTQAGLLGRLRDLAAGPLGALMQTRRGLDVARLVKRPVVIELSKMREDDAKSLIMLFLLTQLRQYYDMLPRSSKLKHLVIVEEAHRLLSPAPVQIDVQSNARAESITLVTNMMAELRKHGIGLMLVEQLPSRLEKNVVKLPGTKILHRLTAQEDREMLASAMNMTEEQRKYVSTFPTGEAALFTEGLSEPVRLDMLNPWDDDDMKPEGRWTQKPTEENQEVLEREVEEHTAKVWPAPTHSEIPWNPCQWCNCRCQPRIRLLVLAVPWWEKIHVTEFVNKVIQEYKDSIKESRKPDNKKLKKIAEELWTQVEAVSPPEASTDERRCGLTLACEQVVHRTAEKHHSNAALRNVERAIDILLSRI
jgi:hypothetical protein